MSKTMPYLQSGIFVLWLMAFVTTIFQVGFLETVSVVSPRLKRKKIVHTLTSTKFNCDHLQRFEFLGKCSCSQSCTFALGPLCKKGTFMLQMNIECHPDMFFSDITAHAKPLCTINMSSVMKNTGASLQSWPLSPLKRYHYYILRLLGHICCIMIDTLLSQYFQNV